MGQGLKTKVTQIAANALNLPMSVIETGVTDTHVVPNPVSTGASTGTALNGGAVDKAGRVLRERLETYCEVLRLEHGEAWCAGKGVDYWAEGGWKAPFEDGTKWQQIVKMAQADRVNLSAQVRYQQRGGTEADESTVEHGVASGLVFHEGASEDAMEELFNEGREYFTRTLGKERFAGKVGAFRRWGTSRIWLRPSVRYVLLSSGAEIPHDLSFLLGVGWGF